MQNSTQNHVLVSSRDFYQSLQASLQTLITHGGEKYKYPSTVALLMCAGWCFKSGRRGGTERDRGKRKRKMKEGSMCICAFKSPQARAECWESRPVPFSWPLRGGGFPSGSMDGDVTSEKAQERDNQHIRTSRHACRGWHRDTAAPRLCSPAHTCCKHFDCKHNSHIPIFMQVTATHPHVSKQHATVYCYCYSYATFPQFILKYECLCILKNSSDSVNVGQELRLVKALMLAWTRSLEVKAAFKIFS